MKKEKELVLYVSEEEGKYIEQRLSNSNNIIEQSNLEEWDIADELFGDIQKVIKGQFDDNTEVVIQVCPANPPYVDATLFGDGFRVDIEPSESLLGDWIFETETTIYNVVITTTKERNE